jgi:hypothetical protein
MLDHLRNKIIDALAQAHTVTLVTDGPAGLQMGPFPCVAAELTLYVGVNRNSDQLLNLEQPCEVLATTPEWELRGRARLLEPGSSDLRLFPEHGLASHWTRIVALTPIRVHFIDPGSTHGRETIDLA